MEDDFPFLISHLPFAICHLPFAICHLPFGGHLAVALKMKNEKCQMKNGK
jgi:hypothetical protein